MIRLRLLALGLAAAAFVQPALAQTKEAGGLLRDRDGKTLYIFDKDAAGSSACYDGCAAVWPAFMAESGAKAKDKLTLHARKDGRMQWGWSGKPLYYFVGDAKPGDTAGDGSGGVWHAVKP